MALSRNFSLLIESMKSDSYDYEIQERRDSKQRKEDKEERKEGRRRERFEDEEKDFKLNPFIDSLEALKNSIVADYNDTQQRQNPASNLAGAKTAKKYTVIFARLIDRIAKMKAEAVYQREKDGKFLEVSKDLALINNFRNNYSDLYTDFTEASQSYRDEWAKESEKVIADIEYPTITKPLQDAEVLFADAKNEMVKVLDTINLAAQQVQVGGTGAATGETEASETKYELDETIKQRKDVYSGKNGEIVKEVKKLIYEKFKKYDSVSGSKDWTIVYSKYPNVSSSLRENTANVIKDIKNGLRKDYSELKDDKSGDITPEFYSVLKKYTEKASESLNLKSEKLISYNSFVKSKLTEAFDEDAVKKGRSSTGGSSTAGNKSGSGEKSTSSLPQSPFKNKEEGDAFRKWVNDNHKEWAEKNKLDASGDFKNSFIRKAVKEFGEKYSQGTGETAKAVGVDLKKEKSEEKTKQLTLTSIKKLLEKGGKTTEIEADYDMKRVRGLALDGFGILGNNIYINLYQDFTCYFEDGRDSNKKNGKWSTSDGALTIEVNDKKESGEGGWAAYYMAKSLFPNIKE
jgi:hypothetical protein